jgi:hypothetical protein
MVHRKQHCTWQNNARSLGQKRCHGQRITAESPTRIFRPLQVNLRETGKKFSSYSQECGSVPHRRDVWFTSTNLSYLRHYTSLSFLSSNEFSSSLCVQTGSGAHPASYASVPGVLSPGVKRGQGVTLTAYPHLVPRSRMSMTYTSSSPLSPAWHVAGQLYFTFYLFEALSCSLRFSVSEKQPMDTFCPSVCREFQYRSCWHLSVAF